MNSQRQTVEGTYKKITQIQHILLRPDTYIGAVQADEASMWILNDEEKFQLTKIKYVPGLYKIFDQILVNAADNMQRDHRMTKIDVTINEETGEISIYNDGKSIPVQIHRQHNIYVAQLIFGHLLTSSNYEDNEKKVTGGRNGFGAKLANIFSTKFAIQTADSSNRKLLTMEWSDNMSKKNKPQIISYQGKNYTRVTFVPDFKKFGLKKLTKQIINLFKKRVYDLAGILKCKIYLNGEVVKISNFEDYARLYSNNPNQVFFYDVEENSKRWQVLVTKSEGQFQQVSFVNSIATYKGGSHINYLTDQLVEKMKPILEKKIKDIQIKPFQIKAHFKIFVNCLIQNPCFDSQIKETLTTTKSNFGSTFEISDKLIKAIMKSAIPQRILTMLRTKQNTKIDKELKKGNKNSLRLVIPKLQDANLAGKSNKCTLILTEGDSAKALAMSGIEQLGRDHYGVFPLKGKPVNVRGFTNRRVMENHEFSSIIKIMGLSFEKEYRSTDVLRYSSVMIMADQDNDGSHIKGLILNFFHMFWPSLCKIRGFLKQFITPIIRCKKGNEKVDFFSQVDYEHWKINENTDWKIKYYKGLGTSTNKEAQQYFSQLKKHQITFNYEQQRDNDSFILAFSSHNTQRRKVWLQHYNPQSTIDYSEKQLTIINFFNQEFIHFSISDNLRSIPTIMDGLKPSQRKILYSCFKRNLKNQIKVAQLAGYVSEHSAYHHGEASLCSTIIGMAQNYPGSNNLNILEPIGQFGTRYMNGKDHASARYIFTSLNPLTRYLFNEADDHIVDYMNEEGQSIQPKYYYPILPLVLINGCEGIGTGWSTTINPHKVQDVIDLMKSRLKGDYKFIPIGWEGFTGQVQLIKQKCYTVKGIFEVEDNTVTISEIPIKKSISDYKAFLQENVKSLDNMEPDIQDIREYHQGDKIEFVITFVDDKQPQQSELQRYLKLSATTQQSNMTLFNHEGKLLKYDTVADIVEQFYHQRMRAYTKRKQYLVSRFEREQEIIETKISFINDVMNGKFKMMTSKDSWSRQLFGNGYKKFHEFTKIKSTKITEILETDDTNKDYNYLLSIPIWNFCKQKVHEFQKNLEEVQTILKYYRTMTEKEMWDKDINEFQEAWNKYISGRQVRQNKQTRKRIVEKNEPKSKRQRQPRKKDVQEEFISLNSLEKNRKTLIKEKNNSIEELGQKTRKLVKKDEIQLLQTKKKEGIPQLEASLKDPKEGKIDSLLSKYLGPSLKERINARIAKGDENFESSYNAAKKNNEGESSQKKQDDYDWLQ